MAAASDDEGGEAQMIEDEERNVAATSTESKRHFREEEKTKSVPAMVTGVEPELGPDVGEMEPRVIGDAKLKDSGESK